MTHPPIDMLNLRRSAEVIERRVLQLERQGVTGLRLIPAMLTHVPDLGLIWQNASNAQLEELVRDYPAFYRYACALEAGAEANRRDPRALSKQMSELTSPVKEKFATWLKAAATLESGYQSVEEGIAPGDRAAHVRLLQALRAEWSHQRGPLLTEMRDKGGVSDATLDIVTTMMEQLHERIEAIARRVRVVRG